MRALRAEKTSPDIEWAYWKSQGKRLSKTADTALRRAPINRRALMIDVREDRWREEIDDLIPRFIGLKRTPHLTVTLLLGRQALSRPLIEALLQRSSTLTKRLTSTIRQRSGTVLKLSPSTHPRGLWSKRLGVIQLSHRVNEIYVEDRVGQVPNGNLLAAAIAALKVQGDLIEFATTESLPLHLLLSCFSEGGEDGNLSLRNHSIRRLEILQRLNTSPDKQIPYIDLYKPEDMKRTHLLDQTLKPLGQLGLIQTYKGYHEYLPTEGFIKLRAALKADAQPDQIAINVKRGTRSCIFLEYILSLKKNTYSIDEVMEATELTRLAVQKVQSRLNGTFGFDFKSSDGGVTYLFTQRPHLVFIKRRESGEKGPRSSLATEPQIKRMQETQIERLGELINHRGYWINDDFQEALERSWRSLYPARFHEGSGPLLPKYREVFINEQTSLRNAYSYSADHNELDYKQIYVEHTQRGRGLCDELLSIWERGRTVYWSLLEDPEHLKAWFKGARSFDQGFEGWPQADLLFEAIAQHNELQTDK
jgi:hypothetical protein